jgi:acetyltransferase-like isoleucine patch superfamily enzyme
MVGDTSISPERIRKYGLLAAIRTKLRDYFIKARRFYLVKMWGMDIHPDTLISLKATLDRTYPKGIHVGEGTAISFDAVILTHDTIREKYLDTRVGRFCQIGARSMILPGVTVGDYSVIGAGSIVTKDVPPRSIVAGSPARIMRTGITTTYWGKITDRGTEYINEKA